MARKQKQKGKTNQAALPVMRPDAAGIDIGATEIFVAVPAERAVENVRSFPTFTQDLYALADSRMFQAKKEGRNRVVACPELVFS